MTQSGTPPPVLSYAAGPLRAANTPRNLLILAAALGFAYSIAFIFHDGMRSAPEYFKLHLEYLWEPGSTLATQIWRIVRHQLYAPPSFLFACAAIITLRRPKTKLPIVSCSTLLVSTFIVGQVDFLMEWQKFARESHDPFDLPRESLQVALHCAQFSFLPLLLLAIAAFPRVRSAREPQILRITGLICVGLFLLKAAVFLTMVPEFLNSIGVAPLGAPAPPHHATDTPTLVLLIAETFAFGLLAAAGVIAFWYSRLGRIAMLGASIIMTAIYIAFFSWAAISMTDFSSSDRDSAFLAVIPIFIQTSSMGITLIVLLANPRFQNPSVNPLIHPATNL